MLETLRTWLNGNREYYSGVVIYSTISKKNEDLLELFKQGRNEFRERRLQKELLFLCEKLKKIQIEKCSDSAINNTNEPADTNSIYNLHSPGQQNGEKTKEPGERTGGVAQGIQNEELWRSCKLSADNLYKQIMNDRAVLFGLSKCETWEDPNQPLRINAREQLAINVVTGYQKVSQLYDQADYVKTHGHLPDQGEAAEENEYDHLPDGLVKQTLDNLRKNYNKIKKREQIPERIALQQKHVINIKKLKARWLLLKPQ